MADNKLELVVTVEVDKANQSIKSVNASLSSMEASATKSAKGATQGIDGMTAAMVKGATAGSLFADAIKSALAWAKDFTVGSVMMAAENAKAEASLRALATAHGIGAAAASKQVAAIEDIGFEFTEAAHAVQRLIVADMDLAKAEGLAKLAKDAAAVQNVSAGEAMESIVLAIESGASRGLRTLGLFVDFQKKTQIAELQLGRALTETEEKQIRYNAVMREGAKIQGAHAAASQTVEGQLGALRREFNNVREDIGAKFQEDLKGMIVNLRGLVGWLKDNTDGLTKFGEIALWVSGILASYALAEKIMALAKSIAALRLASLNPYALLATGVVAAGAIVYNNFKNTQEQLQARFDEMQQQALRKQLASGKTSVEELRKQGMTDDQIRELIMGKQIFPGEQPFDFGGPKITLSQAGKADKEPDLEALKRAAEIRKRQAEVERESRQAAIEAGVRGQSGFAREIAEMNAQVQKWTTFTDDRGVEQRIALTGKAWQSVLDQLSNRWATFKEKLLKDNREHLAEYLKDEEEAARKRLEFETELFQRRLQYNEEIARRNFEHLERLLGVEEQRAGIDRDTRLRAVESVDAQTLEQKVAVEQRKAAIEVDYLERVHEIKMRLFDLETSRMVLEDEANLKRLGYRADEIRARIGELSQQREDIRQANQEGTDAAIDAARQNAANRTAGMIRDHNRQVFDSFKRQAEGVFDALLTKSQSIWSAIGNSFKTALLTAIKDVVSSRVAAMLMQLFTGQKVSFASGGSGGGGVLGGIGGMLDVGAIPVFGAGGGGFGGGGPIPGGAAGGWGTPPFIPNTGGSGGVGGVATAAGTGGMFSKAGLAGSLANLKSFLGIGGSVQLAPGVATTWQAATLGQKLSSIGKSFDIDYDHALDGAMRLDAAKFPSVSRDAMTFVCGAGGPNDIYEVRLLDHATVNSGGETPASCQFDADGIAPYYGIDYLHLYFRDTRYTVAHTDGIVETTLSADVAASTSAQDIPVASSTGIGSGDYVYIERTGTNEELMRVEAVGAGTIRCVVTMNHPTGSFVTLQLGAKHLFQKLAHVINAPGDPVAGRFGPDQSSVISATATAFSTSVASLQLQFATPALPAARYGKLGNIDRVTVTSGHIDADPPDPPGSQRIDWSGGSGTSRRFAGGDNDTEYHITLDFTQPLLDKLGRTVPMNDCRKMYMVFAPRFEITEQELEDGCFLTTGVGPNDTVWQVDDSSKLSGDRYFIGTPNVEERVRLVSLDSLTQITVERGYQSSTPGTWAAGTRVKKLPPMSGFASDAEWAATISNITVTGDRALKVGGAAPRIEESDGRCKYTGFWESYKYAGGFPTQWWSAGHAKRTAPNNALDVRNIRITYSMPETHDLYLGTFPYTHCGKINVSVDGVVTTHDLYLAEFGGTTANLKVRGNVAAGTHTVEITVLFDKYAASGGYYFYFDYITYGR